MVINLKWIFESVFPRLIHDRRVADFIYYTAFLALSIKLIAPIWSVTYLPLGDLPDHAGQIKAIMEFEYYRDRYAINWFTPYLLGYGLTMMFAFFMPVVAAIKVVLSAAVLTFPVASIFLVRALKGDRLWVFISFPVGYSFAFFWGFFSYIIGTSVAMCFLVFCVGYATSPWLNWRWYLWAAAFSLLLFFGHVIAWGAAIGIGSLIVFIYNDLRMTIKRCSAFLMIVPLVVYWMAVSGERTEVAIPEGQYIQHFLARIAQEANYMVDMFNARTEKSEHSQRLAQLVSFSIGKPAYADYLVLGLFLVLWPLMIGARLYMDIRRWLPLLFVIGLFMLMPYYFLDAFYVFQRFAVFLIPVCFLLYRAKPCAGAQFEKMSVWRSVFIVLGFVVVWGVLSSYQSLFNSFKENDASFKAILSQMEPEKKVLSLIYNGDSRMTFSPAYLHFGNWYQAEKGGEVIFSFSTDPIAHAVPLRYIGGSWPQPSSWNPREFDWNKHNGSQYDYFLIRATPEDKQRFARRFGRYLKELAHAGSWYVYGRSDER